MAFWTSIYENTLRIFSYDSFCDRISIAIKSITQESFYLQITLIAKLLTHFLLGIWSGSGIRLFKTDNSFTDLQFLSSH